MDEKMKDSVKITVIATGFREVRSGRHNQHEMRHSFAAAHDNAMDFPDPPRMPEPEPMPEAVMSEHRMEDRVFVPDPVPVSVAHTSDHVGGEVISLDSMRSAMVANFEQDDLDVPAFLRKRGEVM